MHKTLDSRAMNNSGGRLQFSKLLAAYSLLFAVTAVLVFREFWYNGKSFVWYSDGIEQHYIALQYIGQWIRTAANNLFVRHVFELPLWDFSVGQGEDILITLQYYGFGDPLVMLTAGFFSGDRVEMLYNALVIVRLYLAGLFFVCHCRYMKLDGVGSIAGALAYVFCGYALFAGVRHPFFLIPMMYYPLLILGSERILHRENPALFILTLALTTISNYYFAYMQCLLVIVYVAIRYFSVPGIRHGRELPRYLLRFVLAGITGLALAAMFLLPVAQALVSNPRATANNEIPLLHPASFYLGLLVRFMGAGGPIADWTLTGHIPLVVLSLFLLFSKRKHGWLKSVILVLLVFQMLPFIGHVINGFSYVSNRWNWAFAFVVSYALALMWPELLEMPQRERRVLSAVCVGYVLLCLLIVLWKGWGMSVQFALLCAALVLLQAPFDRNDALKKVRMAGLLVIGLVSIVCNADSLFQNYAAEFINTGGIKAFVGETGSGSMFEILEDEPFGRYTSNGLLRNESLLNGAHGIPTYWSLHSNRISEYRRDMELMDASGYSWDGYQNRAFLESLNNVKYRLYGTSRANDSEAYHYYQLLGPGSGSVFEYEYALPIGITYSSVLSREEYALLSAEQKQEALLQNVLIDGELRGMYPMDDYETSSWEVPYSVQSLTGDCILAEHGVLVKEDKAELTLTFEPQAEAELYLNIRGLDVRCMSRMELMEYFDDLRQAYEAMSAEQKNAFQKANRSAATPDSISISVNDGIQLLRLEYLRPTSQFYYSAHDYLMNLGYSDEERSSITLTFPKAGWYAFDEMRVVCQPMDDLPYYVSERSEESLDRPELGVNSLRGEIEVSENKLLCLAVPYSKGWTATVDGVPTPVLRANVWSMALELEPGAHEIELRYETPLLRAGLWITLAGLLGFAAIEVGYRKKRWFVK